MTSKEFWDSPYSKKKMFMDGGAPSPNLPDCAVGLEVELEGNLGTVPAKYWTSKNDPSLRQKPHGLEYVLNNPVAFEELPKAIKEFTNKAKSFVVKPSIRCSTHVHINVSNRTNRQIMSAIALYILLEEVLVTLQPRVRIANLFCRRASDAESIPLTLIQMVRTSKQVLDAFGWEYFTMDSWKYGALNLAAINRYGSLEFRFMKAMWTEDELTLWASALHNLVKYGLDTPIQEWYDQYNNMSVYSFLEKVLGSACGGIINGRSSGELNSLIHTNYSFITDLIHAFKSVKFRVSNPTLMVASDISGGDANIYDSLGFVDDPSDEIYPQPEEEYDDEF